MLPTPAYRTSRWRRFLAPASRWKLISAALLFLCLMLIGLLQWHCDNLLDTPRQLPQPRLMRPAQDEIPGGEGRVANALRIVELEKQVAQLQRTQAAAAAAASPPPTPQVFIPFTPPPAEIDPNPLRLPPHVSPACNDPDVIQFQRYAVQRQHAYTETREQALTGEDVSNPDPDPYCLSERLLIDTKTVLYEWDTQEERDEAARRGADESEQLMQRYRSEDEMTHGEDDTDVTSAAQARSSTFRARTSGAGIPGQLHIIATRMLWAWQHGYTYVNLARTPWSKGVPQQSPPIYPPVARVRDSLWKPVAAEIPFRKDRRYTEKSLPPVFTLSEGACAEGGWDCFFLPWTSAACITRAKELRRVFLNYPLVTDANRMKVVELEQQYNVRFNPDLTHVLHITSFTDPSTLQHMEQQLSQSMAEMDDQGREKAGLLSSLPRSFNFALDPSSSLNPWSLPGLSLSSSPLSSSRGDLFLMSELLRFLMRPNPYMQRQIRGMLQEMKYPGVSQRTMVGAPPIPPVNAIQSAVDVLSADAAADVLFEDDSDLDSASRSVLAIHVRRFVGSTSSVPQHSSFQYLLLASRVAAAQGLTSVFVSTDDPTKLDIFLRSLGSVDGIKGGLGMQVMHIPTRRFGAHSSSAKEGGLDGKRTGSDPIFSAALAAELLVDEEGAAYISSLFVMGVLSPHAIGTLSSHWSRMILELQRWGVDGQCAPTRRGWLFPDGRRAALTTPLPPRHTSFVDLDGDAYFIGDFKAVRHPHVKGFDPRALDPTKG